MRFRTTTILLGLGLAVLWCFGLLIAFRQSALDSGKVVPRFSKGSRAAIDYIEIAKEGQHYIFRRTGETWKLEVPPSKEQVRVEKSKVEELIDDLRNATHQNDKTNVNKILANYSLDNPKITVTFKTDTGVETQIYIGKQSEDKIYDFVNSSERKREVLAVDHDSINVAFKDANYFRVPKLLEAGELNTRRVSLKSNRDGKEKTLIVSKLKDKYWNIDDPKLGPADFESTVAKADKVEKIEKGEKVELGVRTLIDTLTKLRAEDFEPIGTSITVDEKNALLRAELDYESASAPLKKDPEKGKEASPTTKEVLLIGGKVAGEDKYYARLLNDNSIVKVNSKVLEPVFKLIENPRSLRSHDVALFDANDVDAVEIVHGKEFAKLFKRDNAWKVYSSDDAPRSASPSAPPALLAAIQAKGSIDDKDFQDSSTPDKAKELDAKFAGDKLEAKVTVWIDSLKPADAKKDEKKEAKKESAKDEKKDAKDEKKDEKKSDDKAPPSFKDGAKPAVTLLFARLTKDKVLVKREMTDVEPLYFQLPVATYEKIVPPEMALSLIDTAIASFPLDDAIKLELIRGSAKEKETFLVEKILPKAKKDEAKKDEAKKDEAKKDAKDAKDAAKDAKKADDKAAAKDQKKDEAKKQEAKKDAKDAKDAAKDAKDAKQADDKSAAKDEKKDAPPEEKEGDWKLIQPPMIGKGGLDRSALDMVLGRLASPSLHAVRWVRKVGKEGMAEYGLDVPNVIATVTYKVKEGDKEETKSFTLKLGNTSRRDSDKKGVYAIQEGSDLVFVIDAIQDKQLKEAEFRDRQVTKIEAGGVTQLSLWFRSKDEKVTQVPVFAREADKDWEIKSGVVISRLDGKRVDDLVGLLSDIKCARYLNVKAPGPDDFRLKGDNVPLKAELTMKDGKTKYVVTIGAPSEKDGPYYATASELPGTVFLLPQSDLLKKLFEENIGWFSKE
jgi:hypothetical protein